MAPVSMRRCTTGPAGRPGLDRGPACPPSSGCSMSEPITTAPAPRSPYSPRRIDRVLDRAFVENLPAVPLAKLRERRAEASAEESDLSYLRRMLHGRLDIIAAETTRRADGAESPPVPRLPEILADPPSRRVASARYLTLGNGDAAAGEYRVALEARLRELAVPDLPTCPDQTLRDAAAALSGLERAVA